ncbi:efflux RND transporter periplasmic adaptor subunit [Pareuzebyella sediminis]|uniref:efflux RND transporter periplasmic adaptor subunit n=1 Tax=Pareuzebyella sediminis TaxID=2607998 RepID=UPI0011EE12DF|nr:efflux RND transporter periplasmic adaptor subunit [Pareuzebyella sediminis]
MLKKSSSYVVILVVGLVIGYLFSGSRESTQSKSPENFVDQSSSYFSCAMHPEIRRENGGNCPLCGMELTSHETQKREMDGNTFQMTENALALANVETSKIGLQDLGGSTLKLSGIIMANEKTNAVQTTTFEGRIENLNIHSVGDYIKKGTQVGQIYSPEMYAAQDKLLTSATYKNTHQKLYDAARNTYGLWKMSDDQIEELIKTQKPIKIFPIVADVSGTVTEVLASEGKWYKEGDPLFKVSNFYTVWAAFEAYENQLPMLKVGQEITITSIAQPNKKYKSKISFIEPILSLSKRTVSVRATLINENGLLKPGMFVDGTVGVAGDDRVLTVPKSAVMWTGKRSLVYLKPDDDRPDFEMVEVILGSVVGKSYVVLEGLNPGDEVVTNGTFTVDAAAQLQGKKSMMNTHKPKEVAIEPLEGARKVIDFNQDFEFAFAAVIRKYIELKDALVASEATSASQAANELLESINNMEIEIQGNVIGELIKSIKTGARTISEIRNIEQQRTIFTSLSEKMVHIVSAFKNINQTIYIQFCPMADENKGAHWLSYDSEILNPYFGTKMLNCGSTVKTLP